MQTILGAGGPVGTSLAKELKTYTKNIRLVSRNPKKVNPDDHLVSANLLDSAEVEKAVKGSQIVYLTAGLEYKAKVWQKEWPLIISNVTAACQKFGSKLVFFDNMYMYDKSCLSFMQETCPINPPSKKGCVRAEIAESIMKLVWTGNLDALIARSADFYGPGIASTSLLNEMVFKPLSQGKKAMWLSSDSKKHSFTFVPDAAKATALLGNTEAAYGQVWHLPTAPDPFTGKEWIEAIAAELRVKAAFSVIPKWMVRTLGLAMPIMKETVEMMYQYERDYIFDSSKFQEQFDLEPTPYLQGISKVVKADFLKKTT